MADEHPFSRMEILYGDVAMETLRHSHVLIFGVGGVGGHCAEALARCGIGAFTLVDGDRVSPTNLNRQAVALHSTMGQMKVDIMRARILDINPLASVRAVAAFYSEEDRLGLWEHPYHAVIDAIDAVKAKVDIAFHAQKHGVSCVSSMGAGNKKDPMGFQAADLYETSVCPLARAMRKLCRARGIEQLRVVYSKEMPAVQAAPSFSEETGRLCPGSVGFVTAAAGMMLSSETVRMLLRE